jgi:DNA-binding FrmR family transcriptional regulator
VPGYEEHRADLLARLSRVEGQVRGIAEMIRDDRYCIDVLTQVAAATKALQRVGLALVEDHLRHCVAEASRSGGSEAEAKVAEAAAAVGRLLRA